MRLTVVDDIVKTLAGKTKLALVDVNSITKKLVPFQPSAVLPPVSSIASAVRPKMSLPSKLTVSAADLLNSSCPLVSAEKSQLADKPGESGQRGRRPAKNKGE